MFRAIGIVIVLWYVSHLFSSTVVAMDAAGKATFNTMEAAALQTQATLLE